MIHDPPTTPAEHYAVAEELLELASDMEDLDMPLVLGALAHAVLATVNPDHLPKKEESA